MTHRTPLRPFAVAALVLASLVSLPAEAGPYSSLIVFGDSLSDNGNNASVGLYDPSQVITGNAYVPSSTYGPDKTYSNGPVWASDFASMIGVDLKASLLGGTDYAFGGATTGPLGASFPYSLLTQAGQYLASSGGTASADAFYVVAGGGNDARAALVAAAADSAHASTIIGSAAATFASNVGNIVDELQAAGAQHILVWNTPNLGVVPAVASIGFGAEGSILANTMNDALTQRLTGEAGVSVFDIFGFGSTVAADPSALGFANATDACGAVAHANCDNYVYWDGIHPTAAGHRAIADAVYALAVPAAPVPEPQTWALMAIGLAALGACARRQRRAGPAPRRS